MLIKIALLDLETLALLPDEPGRVTVDEAGIVLFSGDIDQLTLEQLDAEVKALKEQEHVKGTLIDFSSLKSNELACFNYKFQVISQLALGRSITQDTVDFHYKRGYLPGAEKREELNTTVLDKLKELCVGYTVFVRGQDFDFPILNSLAKDYKKPEPVGFRDRRDIRTAFDSVFMDCKFDIATVERAAASPLFRDNAHALSIYSELNDIRRERGHRAVNDALIDMLSYLVCLKTQRLLLGFNTPSFKEL